MKTLSFPSILDQKKLTSHLLIFSISVLIPLIGFLIRPVSNFPERFLNFFILLFIQLELFIFIARIIFRDLKPVTTRKEITIMVLSRFALFLIACFIIALGVNILFIYLVSLPNGGGMAEVLKEFFQRQFYLWFKATMGGLMFGTAVFIFIQWQDALNSVQKLREENLIFQNETLKNQVNPHFLFNSLNTLSSLIGSHPETAEEFILKLSSIYRYILENSVKDKVPLTAELDFIRDYFFLHKIRDDGKIDLAVTVQYQDKYEILPVSLQILVENAIKHNKATMEEPLKISIYIESGMIAVKNNLQRRATQMKSTEIGLKNLSVRVKLISDKDLVIEETNEHFIVKVPLLS
jgi:two-component system, LytTR family, sensor kinase